MQDVKGTTEDEIPGDLPDPGVKPESLMSPSWAGGFFTTSTTWE